MTVTTSNILRNSTTSKTLVVTYQSPNGRTIDLCAVCARDADTRPRDLDGSEYCSVSHGLHAGTCLMCRHATQSTEPERETTCGSESVQVMGWIDANTGVGDMHGAEATIYWDTQDPNNVGWAWRNPDCSGALDLPADASDSDLEVAYRAEEPHGIEYPVVIAR